MKGLYLKIINNHQSDHKLMRIDSFLINKESDRSKDLRVYVNTWMTIETEPELKGSAYRYLKCVHCQHEDFREGSRLCDYVCNCCESIISVTERRDYDVDV